MWTRAFSIVKAVELIDVWCTSCGGVTLKPLHLLGSVLYLMSSAQLDSLCLLNEACSLATMNLA